LAKLGVPRSNGAQPKWIISKFNVYCTSFGQQRDYVIKIDIMLRIYHTFDNKIRMFYNYVI